MKLLYPLLFLLVGCNTTPEIITDTTKPSTMAKSIEAQVAAGSSNTVFWYLLYVPIIAFVFSHLYAKYFRRDK